MSREALYVAATRGRESNRLYVDVEPEAPGPEASHGRPERLSARQVLISVAHRRGAEASAHQVMASEWATAESLEQLVREHESLVATAGSDRWEGELQRGGLPAQTFVAVRNSREWDGPVAALAAAEDRGLRVGAVIARVAALLPAGVDPAAALQALVSSWGRRRTARDSTPASWSQGWSHGREASRTWTSHAPSTSARN